MAKPGAARQFLAGMPTRVNGGSQPLGVYTGVHAQTVNAGRETIDPCIDVFGHFIIADAHHALACGVLFGLAQQTVSLFSSARRLVEGGVGVEPFEFTDQTGFVHMYAKPAGRGGIHPSAVHVRAGEGHRLFAGHGVNCGQCGLLVVGPQRVTESHAHHEGIWVKRAGGAALIQMTAQHVHRFGGGTGIDEVQSAQRLSPLREVRVAVPQAGNNPQAVGVDGGFVSRCGGRRWD